MENLFDIYKNMFDRNYVSKEKGVEVLVGLAKIAANSFCNSSIPLNDTIIKLANDNCLNPDQIGIVACEANKAVHAELFNKSEDKYITFPLADSKIIVDSLQLKVEKNASNIYEDDYMHAPTFESGIKKVSSYSSPIDVNNFFNLKNKLIKEKSKIAKEIQKTELDLFNLKDKLSKSISNFNKIATELVLNEHESKYVDSLRMLYEFSKCATNEKLAMELCENIKEKVQRITYKKAAYLEDDYISDAIIKSCKIVNSSHPLYAELISINANIIKQDELNSNCLELKNLSNEISSRIEKV